MTRQRDPQQNRFYASKRWANKRRRHLAAEPSCRHCGLPAEHVDHIDGDWRNNDPTNYQALCASCHSHKTNAALPRRQRPADTHPGLT